MHILGISAFYHDSAAALLRDGEIVAAAQEERFTRVRHDQRFPGLAAAYCLNEAGITAADLDYVVYYDKPLLKFERLLETYLNFAPRGLASFSLAMPVWFKEKLFIRKAIRKQLGAGFRGKIVFTQHHEAHAASAFFPSPFENAAVMTVDGVGEWATASLGVGRGNRLELLEELHFPHSLGLLYSAFTYFCGFKVNSGEYKLMGLAPYGKPVYADLIREKLVTVGDDGALELHLEYFDYCSGLTMTSRKFDALFGGPPRRPESPITEREMNLAASIQEVTEEIVLKMAEHVKKLTGQENLCLAGGVALNCVANGRLARSGKFKNIWIQPASGDAGGALGAALFLQYQLLNRERQVDGVNDLQRGSLLGPSRDEEYIRNFLDRNGVRYHYHAEEKGLLDQVADGLASGQVIGWFCGRMEYGPRALGARSIIGDARNPAMQAQMNLKIKFRESFRPFAPSVLREDAATYFEMDGESPYMLMVAPVREERCLAVTRASGSLIDKVNQVRSELPAITHVDYSARVQTVDEARHGRYYRLIRRFKEKTGCPVIINTSFNIRGEPIVCEPEEAWNCFRKTEMEMLVLEKFVILKSEQPEIDRREIEKYRQNFKLD